MFQYNKYLRWIYIVILMISLAGCIKQPVDYTTEQNSVDDNKEAQNIDSFTNTLTAQLGIEPHWEEVIPTNVSFPKEIRIDADVFVASEKNMRVFGAEPRMFDSIYKQKLLEGFSDVDTDIYYADEAHIPKELYQRQIDDIKAQIQLKENDEDPDKELIGELEQQLISLEEKCSNAPEQYTKVQIFDLDCYYVMRENIMYQVDFFGTDDNTWAFEIEPVFLEDVTGYSEYSVIGGSDTNSSHYIGYGEYSGSYSENNNDSQLTIDEYKTMGIDILNDLGIDDFRMTTINDYEWTSFGANVNTWKDGCHSEWRQYIDGFEIHNGGDIAIMMNEKGIIKLYYDCPLAINNVVTESTMLLPYDTFLNVASEQLAACSITSLDKDWVRIDYVELVYSCCLNDSGEISIIPTWRLISSMQDVEYDFNAIDGKLIQN